MVKITNGVNVFEVTTGAFESIYSKQGYTIFDEKAAAANAAAHQAEHEKTDDELFLESIQEKPVSQWNKDEVKRFAVLNEIDISGTKNAGEAKELIKKFLEEQE